MRTLQTLHGALSGWEDFCWAISLHQKASASVGSIPIVTKEGAFANWSDFRKFLLGVQKYRTELELGQLLQVTNDFLMPDFPGCPSYKALLPAAFTAWALYRRAYAIGTAVMPQLEEPLENLAWNDLVFPFPAFAVHLEKGVAFPGSPIQTIVVYRFVDEKAGPIIVLQGVPSESAEYAAVSPRHRRAVEDWPLPGRFDAIVNYTTNLTTRVADKVYGFQIFGRASDGIEGMASPQLHPSATPRSADVLAATETASRACIRIVGNLCRYLVATNQSLSGNSDWKGPANPGKMDEKAIFSSAQVMTIANTFVVPPPKLMPANPPTVSDQQKLQRELCWHYRAEHMRRPAGSSPDAPKTIRVSRSEIRKDRRPPNALPGGSEGRVPTS